MFESTDVALEYFEEGLLLKLGADEGPPGGWTLLDFGKSWGLDDDECAILDGYIGRRRFVEGEFVVKDGGTGRSMFLVASGNADVSILTPGESRRLRLATFSEGTVFGEMALLDGSPRAAAVQATGPLELLELSYEALSELGSEHPDIAVKIQGAIGRILGARLRGANALILELGS